MLVTYLLHGLIPCQLVQIQNEVVELYNLALKQLIGKSTKLESFHIDKRGTSPELEKEFGENYLQNTPAHRYIIIVTPNQLQADLLYDQFSFDEKVVNYVFRNYASIINAVTRVDCLIGEIDDGVSHFESVRDTALLRKVYIKLNTVSAFLDNAKELQQLTQKLRDDPGLLSAQNAHVPTKMLQLIEEIGDVRDFNFSAVEVNYDVESYYTRLNDIVYVFRAMTGSKAIGIKRPRKKRKSFKNEIHMSTRNAMIVFHTNETLVSSPNYEFIHTRDRKNIIKFLVTNGYAGFSMELVEKRIRQIENFALARHGVNVLNLSTTHRHLELSKVLDIIPEERSALFEIVRLVGTGESFELVIKKMPVEIQSLLLYPVEDEGNPVSVVGHLLCQWWPYDVENSMRFDRYGLALQYAQAHQGIKNYLESAVQEYRNFQTSRDNTSENLSNL